MKHFLFFVTLNMYKQHPNSNFSAEEAWEKIYKILPNRIQLLKVNSHKKSKNLARNNQREVKKQMTLTRCKFP